MNTLAKSDPLSRLGLPIGSHTIHVLVEEDVMRFEVQASATSHPELAKKKSTGFLKRWGNSARKLDASSDPWLAHIQEKHL